MEREKTSLFLGLGILIAGIVVLMIVLASVLGLASNPGAFLQRQTGGTQATPPSAFFAWTSANLTVVFRDLSSSGAAAIAAYEWEFGDSSNTTGRDPTHTYAGNGSYFVRLTVRDANGLTATAAGRVDVQPNMSNQGTAETAPSFDFNIGDAVLPIAAAILTFGMYVVGFLVGGSLVKAGWNLIRPRPETIRIRLKPQNFESITTAEVVPRTNPPANPVSTAPPPTPPPPEA
ncbi:MAG TPA: PKD domain-containing protein [Thermoplasmata archaeon]|jgi:hypothetical protein|nr:PKD domain-containing protein [Thermoplasmata archaeon]